MLSSISVKDVVENGIEIPEDHDYSSHEWGWRINSESGVAILFLWAIDVAECAIDVEHWFYASSTNYWVFEFEEYVVILRGDEFSRKIHAILPY